MKTAAAFVALGCFLMVEVKGKIPDLKNRCLCADKGANNVNLKTIEKIQIIHPSPSCKRLEIVVTLMKGAGKKCLNPESNLGKNILKALRKKKLTAVRRMNPA
ncbi:chemokine (C-X-C motif) ligand 11, duplicate 8 precursor [Danio rerio]|uniref:Chemokine (C-X-C motif) ligand 11, duplicate 8 n=1 Tax=Danio rerio TaxID=7955 RepID=A2BHJ6_DANRE|nr:chemokine (C-X-C motif) ligand 11, duplicate 8 precursor [Danio rerio]|eukprot:NP_001119885.1 chemokine (C-X-C motif) ligand 11, duplicate 8 precursor [Danio rerio]